MNTGPGRPERAPGSSRSPASFLDHRAFGGDEDGDSGKDLR
ncbi:hypothetical protein BQ8420_04190 [Nocardiopsis sp. JB363]|nr:hypothetical protein BQ8420_04190 [Nocardiopsis sp. JB363]